MIRGLLENLRSAKNFKGSFSNKMSLLATLNSLSIKSNLFKKYQSEVSTTFLSYKIFGYHYNTLAFLIKEIFLSNDYCFKPSTRKPVIIDCGSNIGVSVLFFKNLFPDAKIIAFEANPYAFKMLDKNVNANNLKNVESHNIALYDKETELSFFIGDEGPLLGSVREDRGGKIHLKIQAQKLSYYLDNLETVDLIKMDVEGAEVNIINDLIETATINKAKEYIIEYHHNMNNDKSDLSSFLQKFEANGFNYNIKAGYPKLKCFQDMMIHFYKQ